MQFRVTVKLHLANRIAAVLGHSVHHLERSAKRESLVDSTARSHTMRVVDREDFDRRPAGGRQARQDRAVPSKVFGPDVGPGVEEIRDLIRFRVDASQVRPLGQVAAAACQSQILGGGGAPVLARPDVIDYVPRPPFQKSGLTHERALRVLASHRVTIRRARRGA